MRTQKVKLSKRQEVLETAIALTTGDRVNTYGSPARNMECLAALMRVYLHFRGAQSDADNFAAHDAAIFNVLSKVARIAVGSKVHEDNYVDAAAYLAMAVEVSEP